MTIDPADIQFVFTHDKPKSGMWHCGPNACWITATHIPTLHSVRVYSGDKAQHEARAAAITLLEILADQFGSEPCAFPNAINEARHD